MANEAKILLTAEDRTRAAFASVEGSLGRLGATASALSGAFSSIGLLGSAATLAALTKNAIGAMAAIDDFSEVTGIAVEESDKLYQVAKVAGVELGTLQSVVLRLNKAIYASDRENSPVAIALERIGFSFEELQKMKPDEQFRAIAKRMTEFEDGADKTAIAMALSGKSAADALPFFNDLAEAGETNARFTAAQAAEAEKLTKNWNRLKIEAENVGIAIATVFVPAFNDLISAVRRYRKESGGLSRGVANLIEDTFDPQSILSIEAKLGPLRKELNDLLSVPREKRDINRQTEIEREISGLSERLRLQKALAEEARKTAEFEAKKGSRGKLDASGLGDSSGGGKGRARKELDPETARIIKEYESRRELLKEIQSEEDRLADIRGQALDEFIHQLLDEDKAREQANAELQKTIQRYEDMADPLAVYRRELAEVDRLEAQGALNAETAGRARAAVSNDLQEAAERLNGTLREQDDIGRQLGMTFASAFEDAIMKGESLRDVLKGMAQDIARLYIRKSITEPAANYLSGIFTGSGSGSGGASGGGFNAGNLISSLGFQAAGSALSTAGGFVGVTQAFGAGMGLTAAEAAAAAGAYSAAGYGATAGAISAGATVGGGTAAAGAAGSALSTLAAAAPYIAAVVAIASMLVKWGGGTPHAGAVVIGAEGTTSSPSTQAAIDAFYRDPRQNQQFRESDFTKRYNKEIADALAPLALNLAGNFNAIARQYGAGGGFKVGIGFSADGDDKSRGRFSIIDAAGNEITDFLRKFSKDAGKGMQEFGVAAQQGLLQGLRAIDLGQDINAVLDKSLEGTTDYLTRLSQEQTAALLGLLENGLLDDLVKNIDLASASWDDINTRIAQFARIADLKPLFDRVGVSITEFGVDLVNAVGGIDNATAVLNNAINFQQAAAGSANSFAAAIRDIRYGVLDDPGKYEFLDREAQKQRDILASLSDATLIQDYSERLKESIVAAFGLLDPAEQSARSDDFVKKLEEAATLTQERFAVANEAQTKLFDQLPDKVGKAVADGLKPITDAILAAVREGRTIDIRLPAGLEVG